ncbi:MAG: hypothetical protein HOC23_23735 [Halieaceae bacterium]|nr:hypothetical protein [Halieaceae bacterium]
MSGASSRVIFGALSVACLVVFAGKNQKGEGIAPKVPGEAMEFEEAVNVRAREAGTNKPMRLLGNEVGPQLLVTTVGDAINSSAGDGSANPVEIGQDRYVDQYYYEQGGTAGNVVHLGRDLDADGVHPQSYNGYDEPVDLGPNIDVDDKISESNGAIVEYVNLGMDIDVEDQYQISGSDPVNIGADLDVGGI